jgi:hypothetical protein
MMRVGPCIPVGTQLWKADVGQLLGRIGVFLTWQRGDFLCLRAYLCLFKGRVV